MIKLAYKYNFFLKEEKRLELCKIDVWVWWDSNWAPSGYQPTILTTRPQGTAEKISHK